MLWGMINAIQIIAHLPYFNLNMPQNVILFFGMVLEIANFDVLPTDDILIWLGMGNEVEEEEED